MWPATLRREGSPQVPNSIVLESQMAKHTHRRRGAPQGLCPHRVGRIDNCGQSPSAAKGTHTSQPVLELESQGAKYTHRRGGAPQGSCPHRVGRIEACGQSPSAAEETHRSQPVIGLHSRVSTPTAAGVPHKARAHAAWENWKSVASQPPPRRRPTGSRLCLIECPARLVPTPRGPTSPQGPH